MVLVSQKNKLLAYKASEVKVLKTKVYEVYLNDEGGGQIPIFLVRIYFCKRPISE